MEAFGYEILEARAKDVVKITKYLEPFGSEVPPRNEFKVWLAKGVGSLIRDKVSRKLYGVMFAYETKDRCVIAFLHIDEKLRSKPIMSMAIKHVLKRLDLTKPLYIGADSNVNGFKKYTEKVEDGMYKWVGDFSKWVK